MSTLCIGKAYFPSTIQSNRFPLVPQIQLQNGQMLAYSKSQCYSLLCTVSFCICFRPLPLQFQGCPCLLCLRAQYWSAKSCNIPSEQLTGVNNLFFISHGIVYRNQEEVMQKLGLVNGRFCQPRSLVWDWRILPEPRNCLKKVPDKTIDLWKMDSPSNGHGSSKRTGEQILRAPSPLLSIAPLIATQGFLSEPVLRQKAGVLKLSLSVSWGTRVEEDNKSFWRNKRCLSKPPIVKPYRSSFSSRCIHKNFNNIPPRILPVHSAHLSSWFSANHASDP